MRLCYCSLASICCFFFPPQLLWTAPQTGSRQRSQKRHRLPDSSLSVQVPSAPLPSSTGPTCLCCTGTQKINNTLRSGSGLSACDLHTFHLCVQQRKKNLLSRVYTNCSPAFCPHADCADGPRTAGRSGPAAADVGSGGVSAAAHQRSVRRCRPLAAGVCR